MAIVVQPGQFCVIQSRYGSFRVVRADKVTAKQIRTHRWGSSYDIESRESVVFAGTQEEAGELRAKADDLINAKRAALATAKSHRDELCAPYEAECDAACEVAQKLCRDALVELFAEQEAA